MKLAAVAVLAALGGCQSMPESSCSWDATIAPDAGFETRWTASEQTQVQAHNEKIDMFCRQVGSAPIGALGIR